MNPVNNIQITIYPEFREIINSNEIKSIVEKIFLHLRITKAEISISFVGNKQIRELNYQFRGIDAVTDVLSFSINDINPENGYLMLGDILISVPVAKAQAESIRHSLKKELILLVIHGILHLCGYDHENSHDEKKMFSFQEKLFLLVS